MNIKEAGIRAGLPAKTIRYYEEIALITPARTGNGYRSFSESDLHKLTFLARSRDLGFSIENCRKLLELWGDTSRASADVRVLARKHLDKIAEKINALQTLEASLSRLVEECSGGNRSDCPILEELGTPTGRRDT